MRESERIDLRFGDLRDRPCTERVPLVICPFRIAPAHGDRGREAARASRCPTPSSSRTAASCSTSSPPAARTSTETHGLWLEREPGIFERADWNEGSRTPRRCPSATDDSVTSFGLHWLSMPEWLALLDEAGLAVEATYGWFDRRPFGDEEDMIFVTRPR